MPSKAQRAASRQARLSRRRRRGKAAPQNFQAGPTPQTRTNEVSVETQAPTRTTRRAYASRPSLPTEQPSSARPTRRSRRRVVDADSSNASRYLGRELRQIGGVTALIVVILVGLTFVLS